METQAARRPVHPRFLEELDLYDRIRARDEAAVLELLERSGDLVYSCLLDLAGGACRLAEDLTEQAFVALWRSPESFDPRRGPMALQLLREASKSFERATRGEEPDRVSEGTYIGLTPRAA